MAKLFLLMMTALVLACAVATMADSQMSCGSRTVAVHNGSVTLHAVLWFPPGRGPFPAVLLNHGSGRSREELDRLGPYERNADILGPVFARHFLDEHMRR